MNWPVPKIYILMHRLYKKIQNIKYELVSVEYIIPRTIHSLLNDFVLFIPRILFPKTSERWLFGREEQGDGDGLEVGGGGGGRYRNLTRLCVCLFVIIRKYLSSISAEHVAPARYADKGRKCCEQKRRSAGRGKGGRVGLWHTKRTGRGTAPTGRGDDQLMIYM